MRNSTRSQKCWTHFLRKAIKLTLMEPTNTECRQFTDRLLEIYREACRVQRDRCSARKDVDPFCDRELQMDHLSARKKPAACLSGVG
jgi:hypothetical protein